MLLFATSNQHKVEEVRAVLAPLGFDVAGLETLDEMPPEPVEDGDTFAANALIKARGYAASTGCPCLADDSGLAVDALGGAPGIYSARYSGVGSTGAERDAANNALLLERLAGVPADQRTARFVCALCLVDEHGAVLVETEGSFDGVIAEAPRGTNGFGYDPLLWLPDAGRTSAELSPEEKNARSHRGDATRRLAEALRERGAAGALPSSLTPSA